MNVYKHRQKLNRKTVNQLPLLQLLNGTATGRLEASRHSYTQNCKTVAAVTVAKWNCYGQTGSQSPQVHLRTGIQSQQLNFSSRMHHRINITAMICKYRYVPVI